MPCVKYWKTKQSVSAIITKAEDGSTIMKMEGEDYPFPTYPRGYLLIGENEQYTPFSTLKHQIKNKIFNEAWAELESGDNKRNIIDNIKYKLVNEIPFYYEPLKYDALPMNKMCPSVREIYRAWTKVGGNSQIRDYLCLILQEDDAYRFRVQDMLEYFYPELWWKKIIRIILFRSYLNDIKKYLARAMKIMEHCEVIDDMKERERLWARIFLLMLEDKELSDRFISFCKELKWKKVFMTEGDRYHMRGKYYKADYRLFDY